tara:strand:- start:631 stop:1062 length:432 start_codon:yes stop_codon:yes gene_type:complete
MSIVKSMKQFDCYLYVLAEAQMCSERTVVVFLQVVRVFLRVYLKQKTMQLSFASIPQTDPYITFFSMKECPFCIQAIPSFNKAAETSPIAMYIVDSTSAEAQSFGIRSYPTIIGKKRNGAYIEYEGDRSTDSFLKFATFVATT